MLVFVTGARPNFIKVKPLIDYCDKMGVDHVVYNSNQHGKDMQVFEMGTHINQPISHNREGRFAWMMSDFSRFLNGRVVDAVVVVGDTDTSFACALTADMRQIPVAHVEAGMRSYYHMPEESNRVAIDRLSTFLYVPTYSTLGNLQREGMTGVHVGNIMIESLLRNWKETVLDEPDYILMEFHRPENDGRQGSLMAVANKMSLPVKFLVHPRHSGIPLVMGDNVEYLSPVPYQDMITLIANASLVCTDSGGIQADSSFLKVPCVTLRKNTEWGVTITHGTNLLVGSVDELMSVYEAHMNRKFNIDFSTQLWDDQVSKRIINHLIEGVKG